MIAVDWGPPTTPNPPRSWRLGVRRRHPIHRDHGGWGYARRPGISGSGAAHRAQRLLERSHGGQHRGWLVTAMRHAVRTARVLAAAVGVPVRRLDELLVCLHVAVGDRKSTRLNSSH